MSVMVLEDTFTAILSAYNILSLVQYNRHANSLRWKQHHCYDICVMIGLWKSAFFFFLKKYYPRNVAYYHQHVCLHEITALIGWI